MKKIKLIPRNYKWDYLEIEVLKKFVWFNVCSDNTGFSVKITKEELKELLK